MRSFLEIEGRGGWLQGLRQGINAARCSTSIADLHLPRGTVHPWKNLLLVSKFLEHTSYFRFQS
jgi:hypothetical protein